MNEHKQSVTQVFDTVAPGYDNAALRFFPFCADQILGLLKPKPGQTILDVATGTGAVAVALAQAVLPQGRVTGVDLSEAMLARAQHNIEKMGLDNVDLFTMDAEHLDFRRDNFDATVCSFGLFFMPQMAAALTEWARVTKRGGQVLFTSFSPSAFQPQRRMMFELMQEYDVDMEGAKFASDELTDAQRCRQLMLDAGLLEVTQHRKQLGYHLQSAKEWWSVLWNSAGRRPLLLLNDEQLKEFQARHLQQVQTLATSKGIWLDVEVLFTSGRVA
jgi:ubiquinone/menaquinone biosynthesis C-methylase UbiE